MVSIFSSIRADALLQFLYEAADILGAFILREGIAGPAFLVVGFERNPFLAQAVLARRCISVTSLMRRSSFVFSSV